MTEHPAPAASRAFSLVELLAVICIMVIIMVLSAGAFFNFARGVDVTNSAQYVGDALNLARQVAITRGQYAQVRFLAPADPADPRQGQFAAVAIYRAESPFYTNNYSDLLSKGRMRQEGQTIHLPASCAIVSNATYSPLIATLSTNGGNRTGTSRIAGADYHWVSFYFKPDGSTDIPPSPSTTNSPSANALSVSAVQAFKAANQLPPNHAILSLDRVAGRLTVVRP